MADDLSSTPPMDLGPDRNTGIPFDTRNTAPATRARYEYQDDLAALIVLQRLASEDLDGVFVERATDLALVPKHGVPELISIKHRELLQENNSNWSIADLITEVFPDLYRYWVDMDRSCLITFATNAGFYSTSNKLAKQCRSAPGPTRQYPDAAIIKLRKKLSISTAEAVSFFDALTLNGARPGRHDIADNAAAAAKQLLLRHRTGPITTAEDVYREMRELIRARSTDRPPNDAVATTPPATIAHALREREQLQQHRQYLAAEDLLNHALQAHDRASMTRDANLIPPQWVPDPSFVGRTEALLDLDQHLRPGSAHPVTPLVLHGVPGCGKTALALHYAATRADRFQAVRINGEDPATVASKLEALRGQRSPVFATESTLTDLRGPIAQSLPANSTLLIIIDGMVDARALAGLIPSTSLCRVIITANSPGALPGWATMKLDTWERRESLEYLKHVLPEATATEAASLATALHDHPLAIAQAAAYCRGAQRPVDDFLNLFASYPSQMLARDPAPGHPALITATTHLLLAEAHRQHPHSLDLARAFSLLASAPITEATLHSRLVNPALLPPGAPTEPPRWRARFRRRKATGDAAPKHDLEACCIPEAQPIIKALDERLTMTDCIDTLVALALVQRDALGLHMHPMVALVIRSDLADQRLSLAIAYSWFMGSVNQLQRLEYDRFRSHVDHLHVLTSQALELGLHGHVVQACCLWLSSHLLRLPIDPSPAEASRYRDLTDITSTGYELAHQQLQWSNASLDLYLGMSANFAHVLARQRQAGHAFAVYEQMLQIGLKVGRPEAITTALLSMGTIAEDFPEAKLRARAEAALVQSQSIDNTLVRAASNYALARRLRGENDLQGALTQCDQALDLLSKSDLDGGDIVEQLNAEAARICRDLGDPYSAGRYEQRRVDLVIAQRGGLHPDRKLILALCAAADAALERLDIYDAKEKLEQANALAANGFVGDPEVTIYIRSTQGRYHVDRGEWEAAHTALSEAIELQETGDSPLTGTLASDYFNLSIAQGMQGDIMAGMESAERALEIDLERYPSDHPQVALDAGRLADMNAAARAQIEPAEVLRAYEAASPHEYAEVIEVPDREGNPYWTGAVLGRSEEPQDIDQALHWAQTLLHDLQRPVIGGPELGPEIQMTVLEPLGRVVLQYTGSSWIALEVLAAFQQQRTVMVDITETLLEE